VVASQSVQFRVLGPVSADRGGEGLDLGSPKQRLTLALLLARFGEPVSTDQLIDGLWGEAPPTTARKALQGYVSHLRGTLGERCIETRMATYRISDGRVDARQFEALASQGRAVARRSPGDGADLLSDALALWAGPPYSGFEDSSGLVPEIARLQELRISVLEDRIAADLESGASAPLVGELESLIREYPYRERLYVQLMLALYREGRQADALLVFRRAREQLVDELGIEPGPELAALQLRILRQDPSLLPADRRPSHAPVRSIRGYELRNEVARGTDARIYRAFDRGSERVVRVKAIAPGVAATRPFLDRFEPAAQLIARLTHPAITPLIDYWREPDGAYLVAPWSEAGSLRAALGGGRPWSPGSALELIERVGSALAYAHRNGIVHGSIKPENILLDEAGGTLGDFPIVPSTAGPYVAPEVDEPLKATPASDIYSLGLVIHELLTGSRPEDGRPSRLLLPDLQHAIARATTADARQRYQRVEDLLRAIRTATGSDVVSAPWSDAPARYSVRNPFKGLRAFQESDAADFFGRDAVVARLVGMVETHRLVAVVGPSGCGKSSLVRAGLIPALRRRAYGPAVVVSEMFPGSHPFEQLEMALRRVAIDWPEGGAMAELTSSERGLLHLADRILPADRELVLVIDQFEELYSLVEEPATRRHFVDSLAATVTSPDARARVVLTLRADFLDRPLDHPGFGKMIEDAIVPLASLSPAELAQVIVEPTARVGLEVEDGLVPEIVSDTAGQPGALPLMQFALAEAVDRSQDWRLTVEGYRRTGGVTGAIGSRAEAAYRGLTESERRALQQALLRLVRVGEDGASTRRRVRISELASLDLRQPALWSALQTFASHRLLTFDRDPITRGATVEVAHEALLTSWPTLRAWVDERRKDLVLRNRLAAARGEWLANGSIDPYLLSGPRLEQFSAWQSATDLRLTRDEAEFLARSRVVQASRDRRRRRWGVGLALLIGALVVSGGALGLMAVQAGDAARHEEIQRLARVALGTVPRDPEQALLIALAAAQRSQGADGVVADQILQALHEGLIQMRVTATVPHGGLIALSPDGSALAIGERDQSDPRRGTVTLWDPAGASLQETLYTGPALATLAFSPVDQTVFGVDADGMLHRWELGPGVTTTWPSGLGATSANARWFASVSPDGQRIAVGDDQAGSLQIVNAITGDTEAALTASSATDARFSPDGSLLAVSAVDGRVTFYDTSTWTRGTGDQWRVPGNTRINRIAWSPAGDRLAIATEAAGTMVWSREGGIATQTIPGTFARAVRFNASGDELAIGQTGGTAQVVDPSSGATIATMAGHGLDVVNVLFTPDGNGLITTSDDGTTRFWDLTPSARHELRTLRAHPPGHPGGNLDFSADGSLLATQSQSGEAKVWDTTTWQPISTIRGLPSLSGQITISPDGSTVAAAQGTSPTSIQTIFDPSLRTTRTDTGIFDTASGRRLMTLPGHEGHVVERAYTPDGKRMVTAALDGFIALYDLTSGAQLDAARSDHGPMNLVTFYPDGRRLVVGNADGTFSIWRITQDDRLQVDRTVRAFAGGFVFAQLSPDGRRIATASQEGTARLWDAQGEFVADLVGHTGTIWNLRWTPDSRQLMTVSLDGTIGIWDPDAPRLRMTLTTVGVPGSVDVSPDGVMAVTAGFDGLVYLYTLDSDRLIQLAKDRVTRSLTAEECARVGIDPCPIAGAPRQP
jgi:WD40 repeat protein/DNA-binding SARP family transcriptional activator/serine/threonine protein kinase